MKKFLEKYRKSRSNKEVNLKAYTSDEIKQKIANNVKKLREELKMSRTEFAKHVGLHRSTISKIESCDMNVSAVVLNDIANKCGYVLQIEMKKNIQ